MSNFDGALCGSQGNLISLKQCGDEMSEADLLLHSCPVPEEVYVRRLSGLIFSYKALRFLSAESRKGSTEPHLTAVSWVVARRRTCRSAVVRTVSGPRRPRVITAGSWSGCGLHRSAAVSRRSQVVGGTREGQSYTLFCSFPRLPVSAVQRAPTPRCCCLERRVIAVCREAYQATADTCDHASRS